MKAVQTRCPQKALAVWCWLRLRLKAVRSFATCKRPAPRSLHAKLAFPSRPAIGEQDAFISLFVERKVIDGQ